MSDFTVPFEVTSRSHVMTYCPACGQELTYQPAFPHIDRNNLVTRNSRDLSIEREKFAEHLAGNPLCKRFIVKPPDPDWEEEAPLGLKCKLCGDEIEQFSSYLTRGKGPAREDYHGKCWLEKNGKLPEKPEEEEVPVKRGPGRTKKAGVR